MSVPEMSKAKNYFHKKHIINMNDPTTVKETVKEIHDYARFLGIRGIWGKRKADLKNHILDSINNEVEERYRRKPNIDYEKAHLEAELALRSKKLTNQKTWNQLMNEALSSFRKKRRTTKEEVEHVITQANRGRLEKKYFQNKIRRETLK